MTLQGDLLAICEDIVARGRRAGAEQIEAYLTDQRTTTLELVDGQLEALVAASGRGVGVRAVVGGALGAAYSTDLSAPGRAALVERAVRLAREATPDPDRVLPQAQNLESADLGIFDAGLADVAAETKLELLRRAETAARAADPRVESLHLARYGDAVAGVAIASSEGVRGAYGATGCYVSISALARQDGLAQRGHAVGAGHSPADLDPEEVGRRAGWRATASLGGDVVPSQLATIVMEPEVVAELLRGVAQALSADALQKGRSFLGGREGQAIGSPLVTIADEGDLFGGYASAPFDGEGTPTRAMVLVENGLLRGCLHNAYTARRAATLSTGNGPRVSYRGLPEVGPSNFMLRPGLGTYDELIAGVGRGLLVVSTRNVGGINPVSGDYSVGASGVWIERGELAGPVSGVTIAAPMGELLRNVSGIGAEIRWSPGASAYGSPVVRVDGVTIGGR